MSDVTRCVRERTGGPAFPLNGCSAPGRWRPNRDALASQRRRKLVDTALRLGRQRSRDYQPVFDASQQYVRNSKTLDELEGAVRFSARSA